MRSKRSYFTCNFFIFLTEDSALPLIQLLLLIFSKRLDNLHSVCGALDFIFSLGFVGLVFTGSMSSDLPPSPFPLLYLPISSPIVFFDTPSISFLSSFLSFPFAFRSKMLKTSNFYMCLLDFIYTCIYHLKRNRYRFSLPKFGCSNSFVIAIVEFSNRHILWISIASNILKISVAF